VVTQVVPFPGDPAIPVVARYQAALKARDPAAKPGFVSLEGYMVGRLVAAALEKVEGDPTRKALLEAIIAARSFDLGGVRLVYGADDNRGMAEVFLTVLGADGAFKPVQTLARAGG
jgi:branched-chain amino acid transport system substrate-binding protein